jgi:hypothetical protein
MNHVCPRCGFDLDAPAARATTVAERVAALMLRHISAAPDGLTGGELRRRLSSLDRRFAEDALQILCVKDQVRVAPTPRGGRRISATAKSRPTTAGERIGV